MTSNQSQAITYTPEQILAYGYGKTDFVSIRIKSGNDSVKKFLLAIVQGDSPVYYLEDETGKHFYILGVQKELVELIKKNGEYKQQLATYFEAPGGVIPRIHSGLSRNGVIQAVKIMKEASMEVVHDGFENQNPEQKVLTIKQKQRLRTKKPLLSITLQSGITLQRLPLDLHAGLPLAWDKFKSNSITYSLAADMPLIKYWPVTYHQEICFNKFVNDYRQGSNPPNNQLIQDCSVISLPAMVRYTLGRKKLTGFINAGAQIDIVLNKNNIGWLIISGDDISVGDRVTIDYMSYKTIQPGFTAGFGINYKLNKKLAVSSEFRYSNIFNVLPGKAGTESQSVFKAGIAYNIFKKAN